MCAYKTLTYHAHEIYMHMHTRFQLPAHPPSLALYLQFIFILYFIGPKMVDVEAVEIYISAIYSYIYDIFIYI